MFSKIKEVKFITLLIISMLSANLIFSQKVLKKKLNDEEIKLVLLEYDSVKPKEHTLLKENNIIEEIIITDFLKTNYPKELALLANSHPLNEVVNFTKNIIEQIFQWQCLLLFASREFRFNKQ